MSVDDVVEILRRCLTIDGHGMHNSRALTSLLTHCLPAVRRAGEEVLSQFITSTEFATFVRSCCDLEGESIERLALIGTAIQGYTGYATLGDYVIAFMCSAYTMVGCPEPPTCVSNSIFFTSDYKMWASRARLCRSCILEKERAQIQIIYC